MKNKVLNCLCINKLKNLHQIYQNYFEKLKNKIKPSVAQLGEHKCEDLNTLVQTQPEGFFYTVQESALMNQARNTPLSSTPIMNNE